MMRIFLLSLLITLSGCTAISNQIGIYKLAGNSFTSEGEDGSSWIELTYHGDENETVESAIEKWQEMSMSTCENSQYKIKPAPVISYLSLFHLNYFDAIIVGYPEKGNSKWPQVMAQIKC